MRLIAFDVWKVFAAMRIKTDLAPNADIVAFDAITPSALGTRVYDGLRSRLSKTQKTWVTSYVFCDLGRTRRDWLPHPSIRVDHGTTFTLVSAVKNHTRESSVVCGSEVTGSGRHHAAPEFSSALTSFRSSRKEVPSRNPNK